MIGKLKKMRRKARAIAKLILLLDSIEEVGIRLKIRADHQREKRDAGLEFNQSYIDDHNLLSDIRTQIEELT